MDQLSHHLLVMKFGGTSVGNAQAIRQAAQIISNNREVWHNQVVVLSAVAGVTDLLINTTNHIVKKGDGVIVKAATELQTCHFNIIDELITDIEVKKKLHAEIDGLIANFVHLCQAMMVIGEAPPRAIDAVAGIGECLCVRIFAAFLKQLKISSQYVEAPNIIVTDNVHLGAHPILKKTKQKATKLFRPLFRKGIIPVVTGFIAATEEGVQTTLGRGGSDYTASILGAVLNADDVWIWTDVDGVMSADPKLVPNARTIPKLSFREIAELAYYGAKVVHPKTMRPVIDANIGIRVCNTFNPDHPGTRLYQDKENGGAGNMKAVTAIRGQSLVTIEGRGMLGVPGVAARAFGSVAATKTSVPLISQASSEQSICFAIPSSAKEMVLDALENEFNQEISRRDIDRVWATEEVVIVTVVGAGMRQTPGVAGKIFGKLGAESINVIAIAQGSSEVSVSMVVDAIDVENAVRSLHDLIEENPSD
jgi:aspartokinase/homoserine dehydrogenase 1